MAAGWVGAGIAASGLLSGILGNKGGSTSGQEGLDKLAKALFVETDPLRQTTTNQALTAMLSGQGPAYSDEITRMKRSAITQRQAASRSELESTLARQGLTNTSYGIEQLENLDRSTSQMLSSADTAELERLVGVGTQASFGTVGEQGNILSRLAGLQYQDEASRRLSAQQTGQSSGALLGLLMAKYLSGKSSASSAGYAGIGTQNLEALF